MVGLGFRDFRTNSFFYAYLYVVSKSLNLQSDAVDYYPLYPLFSFRPSRTNHQNPRRFG